MTTPLRIAIAGLGTVGQGVVSIVQKQAALLEARSGRAVQIVAVSAGNPTKKRDCDVSAYRFEKSALALAVASDVDVVVELIGGAEGAARELVEKALANGKHVVTANKALIATHGARLAELAEKNNGSLMFEAAVAGGIPIIKTLREGLAANEISKVSGILNGTCNYILTHMWEGKRSFEDVLKEAQQLGYAEAEPSFDVDGIDTAHKLAILASLAFGVAPNIDGVKTSGIRTITLRDMEYANELGYVVKLLGVASRDGENISQIVEPCLVAKDAPLASVSGVFNAVQVVGDAVGEVFLEGRGAGRMPTASAVVADIVDVARGNKSAPFGICHPARVAGSGNSIQNTSSYYIRLGVVDKSGVLAEITSAFRDAGISLKSFLQHGQAVGEVVDIVVITHETSNTQMERALHVIRSQSNVKQPPNCIRIEP